MAMAILPSAARFRSGTIRLKTPVDTYSGSSWGSKSFGVSPSAAGEGFLVDFRGTKRRFLLRHGNALRTALLEANLHRQNARAGLLQDVYAAFLCRNDAQFGEQEPRADDGMAGEFQLFARW